jgi:RNA polymerase sigma factor (sigma-70 family)
MESKKMKCYKLRFAAARSPPTKFLCWYLKRFPMSCGYWETKSDFKGDKNMKNYQRLHYSHYFKQSPTGDYAPCTREECFAKGDEPTSDNPYKQRWFYDPESGFAARLERSQLGENTYRLCDTSLKKEERYITRLASLPTLELDRHSWTDDGKECFVDLPDDTDLSAIVEDKLLLEQLVAALETLDSDEKSLFDALFLDGRTEREFAAEVGITHQNINKRKQKVIGKLQASMGLEK